MSAQQQTEPEVQIPTEFGARVMRLVNTCDYVKPGFRLRVEEDATSGRIFVQVQGFVVNTDTGQPEWMGGGKAYLSEHMTDTEIVRTIFGRYLAFETHEVQEAFLFGGRPIFGPHTDVVALWEVAGRLDVREG